MNLRAVLFDVDFTIARPGPELGPEGYRRLGARFGLSLDPSRYAEARERAIEGLRRHPELEHDEETVISAELDRARLREVREKLPSLKNRQADAYRWPASV